MTWNATLELDYTRQDVKTLAHLRHNGPLGMADQRCVATLFFVAGSKLERQRRQGALDVARQVLKAHPLCATTGATSPDGQVVVRALSPMVEPAMALLTPFLFQSDCHCGPRAAIHGRSGEVVMKSWIPRDQVWDRLLKSGMTALLRWKWN